MERKTVIGLYEEFFFQSEVGAYPMFHMPSLNDMPGFLSERARSKQPMRSETPDVFVSKKQVLRSAKPEAGAIVRAAAPSKAVEVAAAATTSAAAKKRGRGCSCGDNIAQGEKRELCCC